MLLALAAAALLQFAPIATPAGMPAPSFDLHGFTADHQQTAAPVLDRGDDHDSARIAFTGPLDGECIIAQAVMVGPKRMAVPLARGAVSLGEPQFIHVALPSPADLRDAGVTSIGTTLLVVCASDDPKTMVASRLYHAEAAHQPI